VKRLVDNNADVNASCTNAGSTPLCIAAEKGYTEALKLLLDNNAGKNGSMHTGGSISLYIAAQN